MTPVKEEFVAGLAGGGAAYYVLEKAAGGRQVVVVTTEEDALSWADNLRALSGFFGQLIPVNLFLETDPFERLSALRRIAAGEAGVVVTSVNAMCRTTTAPGRFSSLMVELKPGRDYEFNRFTDTIVKLGFQRADFVEEKGQFARRGEVLDIWPADQPLPWRLLFSDTTLESIRSFDIASQRSAATLRKATLMPATEEAQEHFSAYLAPTAVLFFEKAPVPELPAAYAAFDRIVHDALNPSVVSAGFKGFVRWGGNDALFVEDLGRIAADGARIVVFCGTEGEKERIQDILHDRRYKGSEPEFVIQALADGFFAPHLNLAVISGQEVLYKKKPLNFPKFKTGRRLEGLWEISSGDYVVHEKYGIGRYKGLKRIVRGDQAAEYLCIEYKGGDKIYVPPDDFRVVQKYVGIEGARPKLYSLDTGAWERVKQRAKKSAQDMAEELLKLYAARKNAPGVAFPPQTHWERELADSFPYQETDDQLSAIADVNRDLEEPRPMERIVCGDVGFGKTEVAIRAAFKVAVASKQVAVLVPTTVLAEQHFLTFSNRLNPFPVKVAMLSRFQTAAEQKKVVAAIKAGSVDIVVGTHRILSKDVHFKDLGLLIIDEEHRFGVKQKEVIKKLKKNIDVLLLSATPIPRTLSLALSNLRDLSVIETPPYGRLPIETHLGPYDADTVRRIIRAELSRGGQVYYVHNRVETIISRAAGLQKLVPEIRWGVVHGQLSAHEIEKTMWKFMHRELDVLVATTIIESGLDIPTVNTMIVEEAEDFGLAQLYQLRGRIGREKQKAYCYLFYTPERLTEDSRKRLEALQEFSELGSGFRLALRDLEIRGAGNILSGRQHGFVRDIGYELYSRLLDEASRTLHGGRQAVEQEWKTTMDFSIPAFIPDEYVPTEEMRIIFYRRLAGARAETDIAQVREELADRFGAVPVAVENLCTVTRLRILAEKLKIRSIVDDESHVAIYFSEHMVFPQEKILAFAADYAGRVEFMRGESMGVRLLKSSFTDKLFAEIQKFLLNLRQYMHVQ